ncbi:hypothetical protein BMI86_05770 [Thioclava sp. DLFJ5-1]|nr:hypothetical protein BMI86_05770 [Thioclava sp. DLFJ5-1]
MINPRTYLDINMAIFLANFVTFSAYHLSARRHIFFRARPYQVRRPSLTAFVLIIFSALGFLGVLFSNAFELSLLLFRGLVDQARDAVITSSSLSLIFGMFTRFLPVFCFYFAITELRNMRLLKVALFFLMIMSVFPTGVARYMVAYTYIPVLLIMVPSARKGFNFALVFLLSLLFVFPFLNQFRHFDGFSRIGLLPSQDFFFAAHFDAFENFASAFDAHFVTGGYQLLGALLFFVPRTFWPDKPVGSGYQLSENAGYIFNNISMPFLGEGYVNFGFFGIILFAAFIGYAMVGADRTLERQVQSGMQINYHTSVLYFLFGALFFILRGDLLSSFAYMSAGIMVSWFVSASVRLLNRKEKV